ncbi:MAG: FeoB small GTPase domain-containing protein [Candidatus Anstonellales archaeon]
MANNFVENGLSSNKLRKIKIVLIGLPNVGKTTLFNFLTKNCKKTGNYSGKTYDYDTSKILCDSKTIEIIDTPGLESLNENEIFIFINQFKSNLSSEEKIFFVQVVDSTKFRRSLLLTLKLLNLLHNDELLLFFSMSDLNNSNETTLQKNVKKISQFFKLNYLLSDYKNPNFAKRFLQEIIKISSNSHSERFNVKTNLTADNNLVTEKQLFLLLEEINYQPSSNNFFDYDSILLHPYFGILIFLLIMFLVFFISNYVSDLITKYFLDPLADFLTLLIYDNLSNSFLSDFLIHTILLGIFSVLSLFTSMLFIMFFILFLEHSGYVIRPMLLFHKIFKTIGLDDKAIIPMILGFSCNVPAIFATKKSKNQINFLVTIFSVPSIICSARYVVLLFFAKILFPNNEVIVIFFMYLLSILSILITVRVIKILYSKNAKNLLEYSLVEVPNIRIPNMKFLIKDLLAISKQFASKLFSVILIGSIIVYFLSKFPSNEIEFSYAAQLGKIIIIPLKVLGINSWQIGIAILNGIIGKELIISSMAITYLSQTTAEASFSINDNFYQLNLLLSNDIYSLNSKLALITFILFYNPCLPTTLAVLTKLENVKRTLLYIIYSFVQAYLMAIIAYLMAFLLF